MNPISEFIKLFSNSEKSIIKETLKELEITLPCGNLLSIPNGQDFVQYYKSFLNERDILKLSILINENEPIDFYSKNPHEDFLKELKSRLEIIETEDNVILKFLITKKEVNGIVSVYSINDLLNSISILDINGILYSLNSFFLNEKKLIIESQFESINLKTSSIWITDKRDSKFETIIKDQRDDRTNLAKTVCNFNLINKYSFVPEDFYVEETSHLGFCELFKKINVIYSIAFLYDITTIENSSIYFKLNGYKAIKGIIEFDNIKSEQAEEYFKIYNWCYNSGNFNDKIGLARNIISLHFEEIGNINLKGNPFQSIQSSYKIYEKQNIKQYIEIRNKISEQLLSFHDRANKIIETFASGFQKSALALIGFYTSAIAIKLLSKSEFISAFNFDATILSISFIVCSYLYFNVSLWEVNEQRKRFINSYNNLKERYTDLLDSGDIQRILNHDKEFNSDLSFINDKCDNYSSMWKMFLLILLIATLTLSATYLYAHLHNNKV